MSGALAGADRNEEFEKRKEIIKTELKHLMKIHVTNLEQMHQVSIVMIMNCEIIPNEIGGNN